jgi:hypothetical protein
MRIMVLAIIAGTMAISGAKAEWAYTKWGMSPEQVAKASNAAVHVIPEAERKTVPGADLRTGAEGTYSDGDVRLRVAFSFDPAKGGGLSCVVYSVVDEKQSSALEDLMIKRYGEPSHKSGLPAIGMTTLNWDKPDEMYLQMVTDTPAFVMHCKKK